MVMFMVILIESKLIVDFEVTDESGQECKEGLKIIERLGESYSRNFGSSYDGIGISSCINQAFKLRYEIL